MAAAEDPRLDRLAELIASAPLNLVARGDRPHLRVTHIAEAQAVGRAMEPRLQRGARWLDLGTGGGLPGLVLALSAPTVQWTLVDAARKKAAAVKEFARMLDLANVDVVAERAEILAHDPAFRGAFDGVVARAVAPLPVLVELARGFVRAEGVLVAVKGPAWEGEVEAAEGALKRCAWRDPQAVRAASTPRPTWLVTMWAEGPPPEGVPRRPGVPARRPW